VTITNFSNEELTAYLDGEASDADRHRIDASKINDPVLRARLSQLEIDTTAIRSAFQTMQTPAFNIAPKQKAVPKNGWWKIAAAMALAFGVGLLSSQFLQSTPEWQQQAASYHELYSTETLAGLAATEAMQQDQMAAVSKAIGKETSVTQVNAAPDFEFKRAQLLGFNKKPLVQIAYASKDGAPFALCIFADGAARTQTPTFQRMGKIDTATWSDGTHTYLVLSGGNETDLRKLTSQLFAKL
jgi:anti-sigma factor RsiW